ncbi:c-type cytochrome [Halomonas almeriensis]|uniref:c-type cytochrome n=1 Tax=Halomonas almeriensis TaxID=308163 RepID=UPI0025B61BC5|nr:c-type cytochrome [Halomonas almeriensis]MDN3552615.1 c-type cytochrome [Halomonas almeriensis]
MSASKWIVGGLACLGLTGLTFAQDDMSHEAIAKRLAPVGELCLQGQDCGTQAASASSGGQSAGDSAMGGEAVYNNACVACHDAGVAGAPKIGDSQAWSTRLEKGTERLYSNAINGFNAMPAKGGNPNLSDAEVEAAVDYLLDNSQ